MHCPGCAMPNVTMLCLRLAKLYLTLLFLYVTIPCFSITWCCLSSPSQRYVLPYHRVTLLCPCSMLRCYAAAVLNQALLCRHISRLYTAFALLGATAPCATLLCLCVAPHCAAVTILFEASPSQHRAMPCLHSTIQSYAVTPRHTAEQYRAFASHNHTKLCLCFSSLAVGLSLSAFS